MKSNRLASIDIIRALTMLLMIFVNDLWTLSDIPGWLGHTRAEEDGMGLADVVFPAFLFIVGLSIPLAIQARMRKGESKGNILVHILERTFALVVMGLFMVNLENIAAGDLLIGKYYWQLLMALAIILIWNYYREPKVFGTIPAYVLKITGWAILLFLAAIYQGASGGWMSTYWWGILGLIGWAYFLCAVLYLLIGDRLWGIALASLLLLLLNVNEFMDFSGGEVKFVVSASNHASVMLGVLATVIYRKFRDRGPGFIVAALLGVAAVLLVFGFLTRPEWGISKIRATPSWTAICAAITMTAFVFLYLLADVQGNTRWARPIAAAGYSTLTCYLIPYFAYPIMALTGWDLPDVLTTGWMGLLKSLLFALLIIQITEWLGQYQIRLKI